MSNLTRFQDALKSKGIQAYLLTNIDSVGWLTGFSGSSGQAIVTQTDARFITDSRYTIQSKKEVTELPVFSFGSPVTGLEFLTRNLKEMTLAEVAFEADYVTVATLKTWQDKIEGVAFNAGDNLVGPLRMVKSADEVEKIRKACQLADACFDHVRRLIQPGVPERTLHLEIEFFFKRQGADISFTPIAVSGVNSALPHGHASDKPLEEGDFVTLDFGAKLDGYCSDLTRTVVVGKASDRHREVYGQVLKAQLAAMDAMKPGVPCKEIDAKSREVLNELDLAKYFGHGLGHGLGKLVHDFGSLNPSSTQTLAPGQVWTVEPGVYIPDFGGVRIEDDVVVTEDGIEILTHSPKELLELP